MEKSFDPLKPNEKNAQRHAYFNQENRYRQIAADIELNGSNLYCSEKTLIRLHYLKIQT